MLRSQAEKAKGMSEADFLMLRSQAGKAKGMT